MALYAVSPGYGVLYDDAFDSADSLCLYRGLSGTGALYPAGSDSLYVLCEPGIRKISPVEKLLRRGEKCSVCGDADGYCGVSADYSVCLCTALLSAGAGNPLKYTVQKRRFMIKFSQVFFWPAVPGAGRRHV